jgi:hypothetical protein
MKTTIIFITAFLLLSNTIFAQCGDDTYELALAKTGNDAVLVRDFKVKLREGNKRNPSPTGRFSVLMQKGLTYRFTISKDKLSTVEPILQLLDRNEILGTTFDANTAKNIEKFEYQCSRTGNYQVIISIHEANAGCCIGLMAMVTDSAYYAQGNIKPVNDRYVLYAGIENPLNIITDQKEVKKTVITSDRGVINEKNSEWYALIPTAGPVKINVKLYNKADSVVEEVDQEFTVIPLPKPKITIEGANEEYINNTFLGTMIKVMVSPSVYKIQEYYISEDLAYNSGYRSENEYLTNEMIQFIKSLRPQQKIYLKDIRLVAPDGSIVTIGPVTFYIR